MKLIVAISLLFVFCFSGNAQTILLKQDVNNDTIIPESGPNRKHFPYGFWDYGLIAGAPDSAGADILYGSSFHLQTGYGYKRQVGGGFYAIGFEWNLSMLHYAIKQGENKVVFGPQQHKKERFILYNTGLTIYNRFNFVKRGDHLGKYIDVGGYGNWALIERHSTRNKANDGNTIKTVARGLDNVNNLQYGVVARLGISFFSMYATYRISDLFNDRLGPAYPELPRFAIGFRFTYYD